MQLEGFFFSFRCANSSVYKEFAKGGGRENTKLPEKHSACWVLSMQNTHTHTPGRIFQQQARRKSHILICAGAFHAYQEWTWELIWAQYQEMHRQNPNPFFKFRFNFLAVVPWFRSRPRHEGWHSLVSLFLLSEVVPGSRSLPHRAVSYQESGASWRNWALSWAGGPNSGCCPIQTSWKLNFKNYLERWLPTSQSLCMQSFTKLSWKLLSTGLELSRVLRAGLCKSKKYIFKYIYISLNCLASSIQFMFSLKNAALIVEGIRCGEHGLQEFFLAMKGREERLVCKEE